ncbi:MAG: nucleotidyltransferase family protein [Oligoflexales bacterium]|nr:nucleotidyltransferase family protein [Oligoflexales bacterium]
MSAGKYLLGWQKSIVSEESTIKDTINAINASGALMACVVDDNNRLIGIASDSDVRHALINGAEIADSIRSWYQKSPITASEDTDSETLLRIAREKNIREIPLTDARGSLVDIFVVLTNQEKNYSREEQMDFVVEPFVLPNSMLILAGGLGTRLRSILSDRPKPLALIGNKPILQTLITMAEASGIRNFYIAVNYMAEMIEKHLGSGIYGHLNIKVLREEKRLGTAGAIGLCKHEITHPLLVCNADLLTKVSFSGIISSHDRNGADITCAVSPYKMVVPYGVVESFGNEIVSIKEKPQLNYMINAGIYVINPDICHEIDGSKYIDMTEIIERAIKRRKKVVPFYMHEYWLDIGKPDDLSRANESYHENFG